MPSAPPPLHEYRRSRTARGAALSHREGAARIVILWSIPLLPLLTFTVEWLVAWATLGHIPVPGVNDPKSISGFSSFLHSLTALSLLLVVPGGVIAALVYLLCWGSSFRKLSVAAIGAGMPFGVFAALDKFPYDAFGWWFD